MDLFERAQATAPIEESPERAFLVDRALSCFREKPTEPVWKWADREVWLSEKMGAIPQQYDSSRTPWVREWQELPMNDRGIRIGVAMKDARSGFTEGSLNIMRWMPKNWPGNALYSINSRDKAREVAEKRIVPSLKLTAKAQLTDDPDDLSLSKISLTNMDVLVSGSGSWGPFMEAWYRLIILDELESHIQDQGTTTLQRATSRQQDVPDGLLLALCKPEMAGGIIDLAYISGSQKKWMVLCMRCGGRIELLRKFLVYSQCEERDGWNFLRVRKETYYQCQLCNKPIYEAEKREMVNTGIWEPTPIDQRRRPPNNKFVPADPTIESYHMSSYYSLHERSTWGDLAVEILKAHVTNPTPEGKKFVMTNFDGLPYEDEVYSLTPENISALIAGRVEETKTKGPDGKETVVRKFVAPQILFKARDGSDRKPEFRLCYINGVFQAKLPFKPVLIVIFTDKQFTQLKYLVFALLADATAFLIDLGHVQDEDQWLNLRHRPYYIEGEDEPMWITHGLIDAGHRPLEVYRACLRGNDELIDGWRNWQVWPCRGEGERRDAKSNDEEGATISPTMTARKTFRHVTDWCDGRQINVRYFNDASTKNEFYITRVQNREDPRPWLPVDVPTQLFNEWTAEKYSEAEKAWKHEKSKYGPNDFGDCGKYYYVWLHEFREELKKLGEAPAA